MPAALGFTATMPNVVLHIHVDLDVKGCTSMHPAYLCLEDTVLVTELSVTGSGKAVQRLDYRHDATHTNVEQCMQASCSPGDEIGTPDV